MANAKKNPKSQPATKTNKQKENDNVKLTWLPKKTFELEITIAWDEIAKTYEKVLDKAVKTTTVKGFRQGKAPKTKVEEQIGKSKLYEQVIEEAVSKTYLDAVKRNNLRPVINPQVTPVSMQDKQDWIFKIKACEFPEITLGKYKEAVRGLKAKSNLWTPDKGDPKAAKTENSKPNMDQIFDEIFKVAKVEVSDMLIESETNKLLAQFIDQIQATGMTVQQYMDSRGLTQASLQAQYRTIAENNLKAEFILTAIAEEEKMELPMAEAEKMIAETKDPNVKKHYENPQNKAYLALMIRKQKVVDLLTSL